MGNRERKKWAVTKALEILKTRKESEVIENIRSKKKQDDLADTCCQLQAFKYLHFIDTTL